MAENPPPTLLERLEALQSRYEATLDVNLENTWSAFNFSLELLKVEALIKIAEPARDGVSFNGVYFC